MMLSVFPGERHIAAARVAGRGRYVIRSPSDNMDDASRGTKDQSAIFKTFLAYVISALHDVRCNSYVLLDIVEDHRDVSMF